jgi:citrate lyase gamma subunit
MEKPIQKVPFQILIKPETKQEIESLFPNSYEKSFSRFIESIILLGLQEYKFQDNGVGFK